MNTDSCPYSLLPPPRPPAVTPQGSDLPKPFPKSILAHTATVLLYNMTLIITSIKPINPRVILPLSVLILVLLLVSLITVMFHLDYLISLTHLCFIAFLSLYIVLIDVLIYSATQLQRCLINLLTYLLTYFTSGRMISTC